jgi:hypothetical protein
LLITQEAARPASNPAPAPSNVDCVGRGIGPPAAGVASAISRDFRIRVALVRAFSTYALHVDLHR